MPDNPQGPFSKLRQTMKILRVARKLKADGVLVPGMDKDEMKDAIIAGLIDDDPTGYQASFDWQALVDLIIQLLPLIMMLFGLSLIMMLFGL